MGALEMGGPGPGRKLEVPVMNRQPPQAGRKLSMSIEALHVGSIIDGRYEVMDILGEGGFGVVYKARQLATDQLVAVKVLVPTKITNVQRTTIEMRRFEREIRLVAQLQHPNIVRLIDAGRLRDGRLYMALEFIHGEELSDILDREGRLEPFEAKFIMLQVLDALTAAHAKGIVHRDLKPQNIMITRQGARRNAMVVDFGIGTLIEHARGEDMAALTATGQILGTPSYMAPEQLRGVLTPQSDIYAWGLVFYECLTGRRAVYAPSVYEVIHHQMSDEPVPIHPALLDTEAGRLIFYATIKDLAQRYPSVEVLHSVLERCNVDTEEMKLALAQVPPPTDQPLRNEADPQQRQALGGPDFHDMATRAFDSDDNRDNKNAKSPNPKQRPEKHDQETRALDGLIDPQRTPRNKDASTQALDLSASPPASASSSAPPRRMPGSAKAERAVQTQAVDLNKPSAQASRSGARLQPPKRRRTGDETLSEVPTKKRGLSPILWVLLSGIVAFAVVWGSGLGRLSQTSLPHPAPDTNTSAGVNPSDPGLTNAADPANHQHPNDAANPANNPTDQNPTASPDPATQPSVSPDANPVQNPQPLPDPLPPTKPLPSVATSDIRLVSLPALEVTLGLNEEQRQEALTRHDETFAFDLEPGEGMLKSQTWQRPALDVMITELTWGQLQQSRHLMPDLEQMCPDAPPLRVGSPAEAVLGVGAQEAAYICASLGMRLPTAREWEAIARGDEQRLYAFDAALPDPQQQAELSRHRIPGTLPWNRTPEGVYDLSGSAWEWVVCEDTPTPEFGYCTLAPTMTSPPSATAPASPLRVGLRGGSWLSKPFWWQTYMMGPAHPTSAPTCYRGEDIGVRCVRTASE